MCTAELRSWLLHPNPMRFPYDAVVREVHRTGKHFVPQELLDVLAEVRTVLPSLHAPWPHIKSLASFLSSTLDKADGRYDYSTYTALSMLQLPDADDPVEQTPFARSRCDRLTAQLVSDTLAFELAAAEGRTTLLPRMRPAEGLVLKRYRHGLKVIRPSLRRMSLDTALTSDDPVDMARQACAAVQADMSLAERKAMELSMLPVYTAHDEYLFLRTLQAFETTFSLLAVQLRGVLAAMAERDVDWASYLLCSSEVALRESAPLFSMLATMQQEAFRTFRQFTEGASAIQSRNYKLIESLCRVPDPERIHSAAYTAVPDVQARVLAGQPTLDDAYRRSCDSGDIPPAERDRIAEGMKAFAHTLSHWRQTHYRLAVRMLGAARGTGYTEGTPYLDAVRNIPIFREVDVASEQAGTR